MKTILLVSFLILFNYSFSQTTKPLINFKATESANPWIGKDWTFTFEEMKHPMNIEFDGKTINMYYDSGTSFLNKVVESYEKKEVNNYGKIESIAYVLKMNDEGYTTYWVIEKKFKATYTVTELRRPYISKLGEVSSYWYYQLMEI